MDEIGIHNRDRFDRPEVVREYAVATGLTPAEAALFDRYVAPGSRVLDLGVGAGRTTSWLQARAGAYLGVDAAPAMVAAARRAHPDASLVLGDAAALDFVADASCDVAVFSYNGLDYLSDRDRARALDHVARILRAGGTFLFSSHNPRALVPPPLPPSSGGLARRALLRAVGTARRAPRTVRSPAYRRGEGWIVDPSRGGLRTHVADPASVTSELARHGLHVVDRLNGDHPARPSRHTTPWWYYAARLR